MSWRHRIAIVVLLVLAAGPVAGTLCAAACDSASMHVTAQHHPSHHCKELEPAPGPQIGDVSQRNCTGHHAASIAATIVVRGDLSSNPTSPSHLLAANYLAPFVAGAPSGFASTSPPGTAPLTATPFVLRV